MKLLACFITFSLLLSSCDTTETPITTEAPLYLTTMTHMESNFTDDKNEEMFLHHVNLIRYAMDLADEYDATLTIESEQPFAKANKIWGINIMKEIFDRGHGVGTHCDLGGGANGEKVSTQKYTLDFVENKKLVDALIGEENNHGCSGGGGVNDWVTAASAAGFEYINGIVAMHLLAIPEENRPDPEHFTDDFIKNGGGYHNNVPEDLMDRIYLIKLKDVDDFEDDEDGIIVVSNGELGGLGGLAEGGNENADKEECPKSRCPLTKEDVDAFTEIVREVDAARDHSRVAKLALYLPLDIFEEENEEILRYFFSEAQKLQNEGFIQWGTQWELVEDYLQREPFKL